MATLSYLMEDESRDDRSPLLLEAPASTEPAAGPQRDPGGSHLDTLLLSRRSNLGLSLALLLGCYAAVLIPAYSHADRLAPVDGAQPAPPDLVLKSLWFCLIRLWCVCTLQYTDGLGPQRPLMVPSTLTDGLRPQRPLMTGSGHSAPTWYPPRSQTGSGHSAPTCYYMDGRVRKVEDFLKTRLLDTLSEQINKVFKVVHSHAPGRGLCWVWTLVRPGRGATTQPSDHVRRGARVSGVHTDSSLQCIVSFTASFVCLLGGRWLNTLGMAAVQGVDVVLRHSLFDYGYTRLVDQHFNPLPVSLASTLCP
ncbi:unnamed protein product [Boreogadus saida]